MAEEDESLLKGFMGRILRIDLTREKTAEMKLNEEFYMKFLGGVGIATKIIFDEVKPETDPLSPENRLVFAVGPFQGTTIPGSGRFIVAARSPLTGIWGESNGGGSWGPEFKKAGYDALIFQGRAKSPVYLWIHDGEVEFKDASHLCGLTVDETDKAVKEELGDSKIRVMCIGPAGERLVRIACVICDGGNGVAGRTGLGAVMGSKNLKAVAVRGKEEVMCAHPDELKQIIREITPAIIKNNEELKVHGQAGDLLRCEKEGVMPKKNWAVGEWMEGAEKIGTPTFTETLMAKPTSCAFCPVGCHRLIKVEKPEKYAIGPGGRFGPEYQSLAMLGANCLVDNLPALCKANELCNGYGMDTISTGALIGFAMECYEKGLVTKQDTDGIELKWGDADALIAMIRKIGEREGFGAILGEGIRYAAKKIGKKAQDIAVHVKGLDLPAHDPRAYFSMALTYVTATRGGCHVHGFSEYAELGVVIPEVGITKKADRFGWKGKAYIVAKYQDLAAVNNSLIQCMKLSLTNITDQAKMLSAVTGWKITPIELMKIGERIHNLQRAFNVRLGISRKDDTLPKRMFEPLQAGDAAGKVPPLEPMLNEYYEIRGWNTDGKPKVEKLVELGLVEVLKPIWK